MKLVKERYYLEREKARWLSRMSLKKKRRPGTEAAASKSNGRYSGFGFLIKTMQTIAMTQKNANDKYVLL